MVERLKLLVQHRRISRLILRGEYLLSLEQPFYKVNKQRGQVTGDNDIDKEDEVEGEMTRLKYAVDTILEIQQLADQLRSENWSLKQNIEVLYEDSDGLASVRQKLTGIQNGLKERSRQEIQSLPQRNLVEAQLELAQMQAIQDEDVGGPIGRLEKAEKKAEKFVANRIQPTVQRVRETENVGVVFRDAAVSLKDLWIRLNGGAKLKESANCPLPCLPQPFSLKEHRMKSIQELEVRAEMLEKQLQQVSSVREQRLKKAGVRDRAQLAFILRDFDTDVMQLSRQLALCTLQTMLQHIYLVLEEEILDTQGDEQLRRTKGKNFSDELAFLVAEFSLLSEQLSGVAPTITNVKEPLLSTMDDSFEKLVIDVNDMRTRLGIPDRLVFGMETGTGNTGLNIRRAQIQLELQWQETLEKVTEGMDFFKRGVRLMMQDVGNAGALFSRAALGYNLKRREVAALRRTLRDILTFIPFAIILIIPLTPVGHVLVFGFIQRYFPDLFPSQFSRRRQEVMQKYEQLIQQLQDAREAAYEEEDLAELNRAAEAVARLTGQGRQNVLAGLRQSGRLSKDASLLLNKMIREEQQTPGPKVRELEKLEKKVKLAARDAVYSYTDDDTYIQ